MCGVASTQCEPQNKAVHLPFNIAYTTTKACVLVAPCSIEGFTDNLQPLCQEFYYPDRLDSNQVARRTRTDFYSSGQPLPIFNFLDYMQGNIQFSFQPMTKFILHLENFHHLIQLLVMPRTYRFHLWVRLLVNTRHTHSNFIPHTSNPNWRSGAV